MDDNSYYIGAIRHVLVHRFVPGNDKMKPTRFILKLMKGICFESN